MNIKIKTKIYLLNLQKIYFNLINNYSKLRCKVVNLSSFSSD